MANTAANIANVVAHTSVVGNSSPVANLETYITTPLFLISGNTSNGDVFRIFVGGLRNDSEGFNYTYNVKIGSAGTVADPTVLKVPGVRYVGDKNLGFFDEFIITIRSNTSSGNAHVIATNQGNPVVSGNIAYNATVNNYIGVTYASTDKYSNVLFTTAVAHQII